MGKAEKTLTTHEILSQKYPPLLTLEEMATLTSFAVRTLRNWLSLGQFPVQIVKLRGSLRVRLVDIAEWIDTETFNPRRPNVGRPTKTEMMRKRHREGSD